MTKAKTLVPLFAMMFAAMALGAQAQSSAEPRLPRGIPGLEEGQAGPPSSHWLLDAKSDEERFRRIERYAGGTYEQMWQIRYRYEQVYQAIIDENWELGLYHWRKLRDVFNVALMKRPKRTPNAEALFLDETWPQLEQALGAKDGAQVRASFLEQRKACMACHAAEGMPFLNDAPVFRQTARFPDAATGSR